MKSNGPWEPWNIPGGTGYRYYPKDIERAQKIIFESTVPTEEYTVEDIRKMPIWAAGIWKDYYVLHAATAGGTELDEDGIYPDGMKSFFVNRKNGSVRVATVPRAAPYFIESARQHIPTKAMPEVPFDNLKIG